MHPPTEIEKLYWSIPYVYVTRPGDLLQLFEPAEIRPVSAEEQEGLAKAIEPNELVIDIVELLSNYRHASSTREDIKMLRSLGSNTDNDN